MKHEKRFLRYTLLFCMVMLILSCKKEKSNPVITWENPTDIQYGIPLSETQLNATADVAGTFNYSPKAEKILAAELKQELKVAFTPDDKDNYNSVSKSVYLNVIKGEPQISWENPADIIYETPLGEEQLNATANIPGTFIYTPELGALLDAAQEQELSVEFTPEDLLNYNTMSKTVVMNILKRDPLITWKQPMDMFFDLNDPEPITEKQLNATADVEGELNYISLVPNVTVLTAGKRELKVQFTPKDKDNYNSVTKTVLVHVSESAGKIYDIDNNGYHTVKIGTQTWMAEDLRTTKYNDGTDIPLVENKYEVWNGLTTPAYTWYEINQDDSYRLPDVAEYNWYVVETNKLCPSGWHVPTREEWNEMFKYLMDNGYSCDGSYNPEYPVLALALIDSSWETNKKNPVDCVPGNKKSIDLINKSGFTALATLNSDHYGVKWIYWWTATIRNWGNDNPYAKGIQDRSSWIFEKDYSKNAMLSVRCIKD